MPAHSWIFTILEAKLVHNLSQDGEAGASVVADLEEPPVLRAQGRSDGNGLPLKNNAPCTLSTAASDAERKRVCNHRCPCLPAPQPTVEFRPPPTLKEPNMLTTNYCHYNFSNPDYDIIDRPTGTDDYLFLYFLTPMKIRLHGRLVPTKPGACILIPPHTQTYYQAMKHFTNSFVHFSGDEAAQLVAQYPVIPVNEIFYPMDVNEINRILKEIYIEDTARQLHYEEAVHQLICKLFLTLSRQLNASTQIPEEDMTMYEAFQKARLTLLTHPERDWDTASMAALVNLGISQFYEYYKRFFRASPKAELIRVRLERAQYLLLHENFSIAVVAQYCGFSNLSHFTRYFKGKYGCTPGEFRRKNLL